MLDLVTLFLAVAMLITGTINTISTKFQDMRVVKGVGDGPPTPFEHPFSQTAAMFTGELLCLAAYYISILPFWRRGKTASAAAASTSGEEGASLVENDGLATDDDSQAKKKKPKLNPLILWIPACCDLGGTTLLNVGLFLTYASVYQMLRGIVVVFNGLLSMIFLKQRLYPHHWGGIILILVGTIIVGLNNILFPKTEGHDIPRNPTLGNLLVIAAQVLAAIQYVVEEKFLSKYDAPPLQVVGWEGFWGLSMCSIVLFVLYWIPGGDAGSMENCVYVFAQMYYDWKLLLAVVGSVFSIAFFNFFGISITQRISSTTRSTIDSMRTFLIWVVSLIIGWETFSWLQVCGFMVLVLGSTLYNEVIKIPFYKDWYQRNKAAYLEKMEAKRLEKEQKDYEKMIERRRNLRVKYSGDYGSYGTNVPTN